MSEHLPQPAALHQRGLARCAVAAVLFGASTPFASRLAAHTTAPMLAGLLYVGAALAVAPVARRRRLSWSAVRRGRGWLAVAVGAGGFLGPLLLAGGLARAPAATVSLLLNLELVATSVLAVVFFREHLGGRVIAGGAAVVVAGGLLVGTGAAELRVGALFVMGACLCWGLDNCVTARLEEISPEHITVAKGVVAGTTNLLLAFALGAPVPSIGVAAGALVVGGVGYGASITLWVTGARDLGAARGQLVFSAAPFVGVLVAWGVFGDPVRPVEAVAVVLAVFGVSRVLGSHHEHPHRHEPTDHDHEHVHDDIHHAHVHPGAPAELRHAHRHHHEVVVHAHPHVPDLHHRHVHAD